MAFEKLEDTALHARARMPIQEIVTFLESRGDEGMLQDPRKHFHHHRGFYRTSAWNTRFGQRLTILPRLPREKSLFIHTLKQDSVWASVAADARLEYNAVPWQLIVPLLSWQPHREEGLLLPSQGKTIFVMEVPDGNDDLISETVSLSLHPGAVASEYWLDLVDVEGGSAPCHKGQVSISVA